jgi:hypothetical protein
MRIPLLCGAAFYVVHSYNWKFLRSVHNLFTCTLLPPSPAGLRVEISCETDKKKINFIFNCSEKIFLTKKPSRAWPEVKETNNGFRENFRANRTAMHSESQLELEWLPGPERHLRVDRSGLFAQFSASVSDVKTLSELADAGN